MVIIIGIFSGILSVGCIKGGFGGGRDGFVHGGISIISIITVIGFRGVLIINKVYCYHILMLQLK